MAPFDSQMPLMCFTLDSIDAEQIRNEIDKLTDKIRKEEIIDPETILRIVEKGGIGKPRDFFIHMHEAGVAIIGGHVCLLHVGNELLGIGVALEEIEKGQRHRAAAQLTACGLA